MTENFFQPIFSLICPSCEALECDIFVTLECARERTCGIASEKDLYFPFRLGAW